MVTLIGRADEAVTVSADEAVMLPTAPVEFDHAWRASQTVEQQQIPQKESVDLHSQAQHRHQHALMNVEHPEQLCGGSGIWPSGRMDAS